MDYICFLCVMTEVWLDIYGNVQLLGVGFRYM